MLHMIYGLGERLQEQRVLRNISQKTVAASLGVSPSIISNYESGERTPSLEVLTSLARFYCCSTDYLLGLDKTDKRNVDVSMLSDDQIKLLQHFLASLK